jgi:hypothetical protein
LITFEEELEFLEEMKAKTRVSNKAKAEFFDGI